MCGPSVFAEDLPNLKLLSSDVGFACEYDVSLLIIIDRPLKNDSTNL